MRALRPRCRERVVGIDFSQGMLEVARQRTAEAPGAAQLEFVRGDVLTMPFAAAFDLAVSFGAFGHILPPDEPRFVAEIARVLKPGGLLLLTLPDLQQVAQLVTEDRLEDEAYTSLSGPITPLDMIFGHSASLARGNQLMAHRTGFTARTLRKLLIEAGFVDVALRQGHAFDLWATGCKPGQG